MAVRTQPLSVLQKENAEINRGKTTIPKSGGLKVQQPDLPDRRALSTITNKLKPPNSGLATSVCPHKPEDNNKGGVSGKISSAKNGRAGTVPRPALGDITNGVESFKAPDTVVKQKKAQRKNVKMVTNPKYELTEEEKQKADAWAREGIERVQFSGKDMEALKEMITEEGIPANHSPRYRSISCKTIFHSTLGEDKITVEVNKRVAQALGYRSEIPCFLPRAFQKDSPVITDVLEVDPLEDFCKKGDSPCDDMKLEDVDYDESFLECLEIL